MNNRLLSFIFLTCFLFSALSCIKESDDTEYPYLEKEIEVGDAVPDFTVYEKLNNTGNIFSSKEFLGKTSVLLFFNTGCKDCQREMPKINYVYETLQNESAYQVVAIARDQGEDEVKAYWTEHAFTMPAYVDPGRKVYTLFANQTVPRIYLINPQGKVVWIAVEELNISQEELLERIIKVD